MLYFLFQTLHILFFFFLPPCDVSSLSHVRVSSVALQATQPVRRTSSTRGAMSTTSTSCTEPSRRHKSASEASCSDNTARRSVRGKLAGCVMAMSVCIYMYRGILPVNVWMYRDGAYPPCLSALPVQYACPEVEFFWRVQQVMKSSSHTLRVQILDREGERRLNEYS